MRPGLTVCEENERDARFVESLQRSGGLRKRLLSPHDDTINV